MVHQFVHLRGRQWRALGEMLAYPIGFVLEGEGTRQMIEGLLAHPMNQVLRGIEGRRVGRCREEFDRRALHRGPAAQCGDFRQQRQDGRLHLLAVGAGVVQQQGDRPESGLEVAQERQHHHEHPVVGFALGAAIGMGGSAAEVDAEKPIQALSAAFIALHLRCRMLRRPGVTGTRDGAQGEFIQRHEDPIRW